MRSGIFAVMAMLSGAAGAQVPGYDACVDQVAADPALAERTAEAWGRDGGGAAAGHCRALALAALGARGRAAALLAALGADDRTLPDATRAEILVQSGEFYLADGNLAAAMLAVEQSLRLLSTNPAALTLRARLRAEAGGHGAALADLDAALAAAPPTAERLALRASTKRRLGDLIGAQGDALWAIQLDPGHAAAWLERGSAEAALQRPAEARASLMQAIGRDTDGSVKPLAQLALQRLEAGIE